MLVEDHDKNKTVGCLVCKTGIKVGGSAGPSKGKRTPPQGK